jgi:hypothetical protein
MTQLDNMDAAPVPMPALVVPKVWCAGGRICWRSGDPVRSVGDLSRVLYDFADLKRANQVSGFVEKYGPLYLCAEHRLFAMHSRPNLCSPNSRGSGAGLEIHESVADVLGWAGQARSLLQLGDKAKTGGPIAADEWLRAGLVLNSRPSSLPTLGADSLQLIQGLVNWWLSLAAPRPFFALKDNRRFELLFTSGDGAVSPPRKLESVAWQIAAGGLLWVALALQLASAISGGAGLATCSACGTLFLPRRVPAQMRNRFCPQCGTRAAWRLAKRKHRSG